MFFFALYEIGVDNRDLAICRAWSKKHAIKKFKRMYCGIHFDDCVFRIRFNKYGILMLSDY